MFEDGESIHDFWKLAPPSASYLFLIQNSSNATASAVWMKEKLKLGRVVRDRWSNTRSNTKLQDQLHFCTRPLHQAGGWVSDVLQQWVSARKRIDFCWSEGNSNKDSCCVRSTRLDADYSWIPWPMTGTTGRVVLIDTDHSPPDLKNAVALVQLQEERRSGSMPSWALDTLLYAESRGAKAVIFIGYKGESLFPLKCQGSSKCAIHPILIPVTMIPYHVGAQLVSRLRAQSGSVSGIHMNATDIDGPSLHAGIDTNGRLYEVGWTKFPSLSHIAWAAQYNDYLKGLDARLSNEKDVVVVDIYTGDEDMEGEHGLQQNVTLPDKLWSSHVGNAVQYSDVLKTPGLLLYENLELDLHLNCPGTRDADCPVWDHMVQLFVCCDDPRLSQRACDPCPTTLWTPNERGSKVICGRELGRWATPFRRRSGRWVTDVSHLAPLITSTTCTFTIQSTPWAGTWRPKLSLRFSNSASNSALTRQMNTRLLLPVPFTSQIFDSTYNSKFTTFTFETPTGLLRALLVVYITGHGSDENNCAEFCVTSHHFRINSREYSVASWTAGSAWGCADRVEEGVVPNQHGTWMYGRNGWCDGQDVKPYVVDITADVVHQVHTATNSLEYFAKYNGHDPNPHQSPGYIMMSAHLQLFVMTEHPPTALKS